MARRGIKQVWLQGNVASDPTVYSVKDSDSDGKVVSMDVAVNDVWKDRESGEMKESVDYFRVKLFHGAAKVAAEYVKKGKSVSVIGNLKTTRYTDKEGVERFSVEIHADELLLGADPKAEQPS